MGYIDSLIPYEYWGVAKPIVTILVLFLCIFRYIRRKSKNKKPFSTSIKSETAVAIKTLFFGYTIYGYLFGSALATTITLISFLICLLCCTIHWRSMKCKDFTDYFTVKAGWLTALVTLGIGAIISGYISYDSILRLATIGICIGGLWILCFIRSLFHLKLYYPKNNKAGKKKPSNKKRKTEKPAPKKAEKPSEVKSTVNNTNNKETPKPSNEVTKVQDETTPAKPKIAEPPPIIDSKEMQAIVDIECEPTLDSDKILVELIEKIKRLIELRQEEEKAPSIMDEPIYISLDGFRESAIILPQQSSEIIAPITSINDEMASNIDEVVPLGNEFNIDQFEAIDINNLKSDNASSALDSSSGDGQEISSVKQETACKDAEDKKIKDAPRDVDIASNAVSESAVLTIDTDDDNNEAILTIDDDTTENNN